MKICIIGCKIIGISTSMEREHLTLAWAWNLIARIAEGGGPAMDMEFLGRSMARFTSGLIAETGLPG
jgi:hypothetical protein